MSDSILGLSTADSAVNITPSDSVVQKYSLVYVGVGGDVAIVDVNGNASLWKNVPSGQYISVLTSLVKATGTTATNLVGVG